VGLFGSSIGNVSLAPFYPNAVAVFYVVVEGYNEIEYSMVFPFLLVF
jgi:L-cystine uptake protein TcyP (sodium:dicarboxylate symporter family)